MRWFEGEKMPGESMTDGLIPKEPGLRERRFAVDAIY